MPIVTVTVLKAGKKFPLTEEQLKGIFKQNDKNGDGLLSKEELKEAFKNLGALFPGWRASRGVALSLKSDALIKARVSPIISIGFWENKPRLPQPIAGCDAIETQLQLQEILF
ncbi:hypothetical protein RJ640_020256 [Escallonia rubra]|uniref:EF-hand domain-containing protein n=1 Tax=Escallonia rubra TaxID=112253 RepID=A0AA88SNZ4_9ASTE|nr:hypothetical protein RJ640_020256 [Escallonia rubra]